MSKVTHDTTKTKILSASSLLSQDVVIPLKQRQTVHNDPDPAIFRCQISNWKSVSEVVARRREAHERFFAFSSSDAPYGELTSFPQNLVGSIDGFTKESHIPRAFTCFILLPVIGNVVEHLVATSFALKVNLVVVALNQTETMRESKSVIHGLGAKASPEYYFASVTASRRAAGAVAPNS